MYQPRRASRSEFVPIRTQRYHVRSWGSPVAGRPPLVLVHGWMDVSASWQFVVDALAEERWILAPDWRGFGLTEGPPVDCYWFPDYLADLDLLMDRFVGDTPVDLVGHSMGGNVAMLYAGSRPERIARLVNLEGFGLPASAPSFAPKRYARWMDELKALGRQELALSPYPSLEAVAQRLMKNNRRLEGDKARWLASHWGRQGDDGLWHLRGDPAHKLISAYLYRVDEVLACYESISAPTLWVEASGDHDLEKWFQHHFTLEEAHQRLQRVPRLERARIEDAGHMLHHDQPEALARQIETFLRS